MTEITSLGGGRLPPFPGAPIKRMTKVVPQRVLSKVADFGGDAAAATAIVGFWGEVIPLVFGVLAALWFVLRFVNFIRVNVFDKDPWTMR